MTAVSINFIDYSSLDLFIENTKRKKSFNKNRNKKLHNIPILITHTKIVLSNAIFVVKN